MDDTIKKLIEIEKNAQHITEEALFKLEHLDEAVAKRSKEIYDDNMLQAKQKIEELSKLEEMETAQRIAEIEEETKRKLDSIRKEFSQSSAKWEEEIFNRITGGGYGAGTEPGDVHQDTSKAE